MSDEDFNEMHREWQEEKDRLLIKLQENNADSKSVYKRMDFILKFSGKLPELFKKGTPEEKKVIISTMIKSIIFDGENVQIELKDTFKALQNVNKVVKISVRNPNLRTPENASISTKNDVLETSSEKWAGGEIVLDFLHAHRVLFSVLRTCQQNLFAIRILLRSIRTQIRSNPDKALPCGGYKITVGLSILNKVFEDYFMKL